jgi:hypothetical protein
VSPRVTIDNGHVSTTKPDTLQRLASAYARHVDAAPSKDWRRFVFPIVAGVLSGAIAGSLINWL